MASFPNIFYIRKNYSFITDALIYKQYFDVELNWTLVYVWVVIF